MAVPDAESFYYELSERIKTERIKRKITLEKLGDHLGITRSAINNLEKGRSRPSLYQLIRIAELFNMDYTELIPYGQKTPAPRVVPVKKKIRDENMVSDKQLDQSEKNVVLNFLTTLHNKK